MNQSEMTPNERLIADEWVSGYQAERRSIASAPDGRQIDRVERAAQEKGREMLQRMFEMGISEHAEPQRANATAMRVPCHASRTPGDLISLAVEMREQCPASLLVLWCRTEAAREELSDELLRLSPGYPVIPIVVPGDSCNDPGSWPTDLARILVSNRSMIESASLHWYDRFPFAVLLLSRTSLATSQGSVDVTLPVWFPTPGGRAGGVWVEALDLSSEFHLGNAT
jgi:hypothetical protein